MRESALKVKETSWERGRLVRPLWAVCGRDVRAPKHDCTYGNKTPLNARRIVEVFIAL